MRVYYIINWGVGGEGGRRHVMVPGTNLSICAWHNKPNSCLAPQIVECTRYKSTPLYLVQYSPPCTRYKTGYKPYQHSISVPDLNPMNCAWHGLLFLCLAQTSLIETGSARSFRTRLKTTTHSPAQVHQPTKITTATTSPSN
jgi:hypothetical protein